MICHTSYEFQKAFPNDSSCLDTIMTWRWGEKPVCQECDRETRFYRIRKRRAFACQFCGAHVYPCAGTPFEKSSTPLRKWFYAIYLSTVTRHRVSAKELERQLGVSYKCAWRISHQLRKLLAERDGESLASRHTDKVECEGAEGGEDMEKVAIGRGLEKIMRQALTKCRSAGGAHGGDSAHKDAKCL